MKPAANAPTARIINGTVISLGDSCGPCRMMAPAYEAAAGRFADQVRFFKLNSDQNQEAAGKLGIRGIPTLIAWKDGALIANQAGAQTGEGLSRWIQSTFGLSA